MTLDSRSQSKQFFQNFLLAGAIGTFSKTLIAPLETHVKYAQIINSDGTSYLKQMLKDQGRIALWKDNGLKIKNYSPAQGFNFAFYDLFKKSFCSSFDPKTEFWGFLLSHMVAGAAAGGLALLILYPLQLSKPSFKSMLDAKKKSDYSTEAILKRYKWFNITAVGVMVYRSVLFGGYETAKKAIFPQWKEKSFGGKYLTAVGVAVFAGLLSTSVDVVRKRLMMKFVASDGETVQYKGALDCAKKIYNEAGWKAFVRINRLSWVSSIAAALNLVLYDELQSYLFPEKEAIV